MCKLTIHRLRSPIVLNRGNLELSKKKVAELAAEVERVTAEWQGGKIVRGDDGVFRASFDPGNLYTDWLSKWCDPSHYSHAGRYPYPLPTMQHHHHHHQQQQLTERDDLAEVHETSCDDEDYGDEDGGDDGVCVNATYKTAYGGNCDGHTLTTAEENPAPAMQQAEHELSTADATDGNESMTGTDISSTGAGIGPDADTDSGTTEPKDNNSVGNHGEEEPSTQSSGLPASHSSPVSAVSSESIGSVDNNDRGTNAIAMGAGMLGDLAAAPA
eukprot:COSAG02_NODE_4863_length_4889_cov_1.815240_3_plen_271_part_00